MPPSLGNHFHWIWIFVFLDLLLLKRNIDDSVQVAGSLLKSTQSVHHFQYKSLVLPVLQCLVHKHLRCQVLQHQNLFDCLKFSSKDPFIMFTKNKSDKHAIECLYSWVSSCRAHIQCRNSVWIIFAVQPGRMPFYTITWTNFILMPLLWCNFALHSS